MTDQAAALPKHHAATQSEVKVIVASSLGTVFEWYDFYLYGLLATVISAQFFSAACYQPNQLLHLHTAAHRGRHQGLAGLHRQRVIGTGSPCALQAHQRLRDHLASV